MRLVSPLSLSQCKSIDCIYMCVFYFGPYRVYMFAHSLGGHYSSSMDDGGGVSACRENRVSLLGFVSPSSF